MREVSNFCKQTYLKFYMRLATLADRPAKLAKSAIFYEKTKNFIKNGQKVEVNNLAGNGRFYQILLKTCSLVSLDSSCCILDHYTILINFGSVLNFGKKIENFSKIRFRRNFSEIFQL